VTFDVRTENKGLFPTLAFSWLLVNQFLRAKKQNLKFGTNAQCIKCSYQGLWLVNSR